MNQILDDEEFAQKLANIQKDELGMARVESGGGEEVQAVRLDEDIPMGEGKMMMSGKVKVGVNMAAEIRASAAQMESAALAGFSSDEEIVAMQVGEPE